MKIFTTAFVLCVLVGVISLVHGGQSVRSEEEKDSLLPILGPLKQGLGQFLVNGLESLKTLLSGSQNWRGMIYLNGKNPYEDDAHEEDITSEKSEILSLLYLLVEQMDLLLKDRMVSKSRDLADDEYDEDEYYDYDWLYGDNDSNVKDSDDGETDDDDDDNDEDDYSTYDLLNYFNGDDDDEEDDDDADYDEDNDEGDYADRDGEEDSTYGWSNLWSNGNEFDDGDEEYEEELDDANLIGTESNNKTTNDKLEVQTTKDKDSKMEMEMDNMIDDIKPEVVNDTAKETTQDN